MATTTGSRGRLRGQVVGNCDDYGIDEGSVSIILRTFIAVRGDSLIQSIDMVRGVLLFAHAQPNDPKSGLIYVYDKGERVFWGLNFDEGWDEKGNQFFTQKQFEDLVEEYSLTDYAACPSLLAPLVKVASA
jgi:hypothetical protein